MNSKNYLMMLKKNWMPQNYSRRKELALWKKFYRETMHIISNYGKMDEKIQFKKDILNDALYMECLGRLGYRRRLIDFRRKIEQRKVKAKKVIKRMLYGH